MANKICGIYGIQNTLTGEWYVGQSQNIRKRYNTHMRHLAAGCHENEHLQRSFNKYGEEHFSFQLLERCSVTELDECEKKWIAEKNSKEHGFNMTYGGGGMRGYHFSDEVRERMSAAHKGHAVSEEQKQKMSLSKSGENHHFFGKHLSEEHKQKLSETFKVLNAHLRKPVVCVETGEVFESISAAAKSIGKTYSTLSEARKMGKTCGGFHWAFYEEVAS